MKKSGAVVVMGMAGIFVSGCAGPQGAVKPGPSFVVTTPVVELSPGGKVIMYGTGFAPKQEINLILKDPSGGMSSIASMSKPAPVVSQEGLWATSWDYSSFLARTLKPGMGLLTVTDKEFKPLGQAPVVFVAPPPKPKPEAAKPEAAKPEASKSAPRR